MLEDRAGKGISLHQLAANNPTFANAFNRELKRSINNEMIFPKREEGIDNLTANPNWDANSYLKSKFTYGKDLYVPSIYFVKFPESLQSNDISILIGEEGSCCDEVPGWKDGIEVLVSENEIMNSTGINIFVGVGEIQEAGNTNTLPNQVPKPEQAFKMANVDIDVDRHQIKKGYRYERCGRSEIRTWVAKYFPNSINPKSKSRWTDFENRSISRGDISDSKVFYNDLDAFQMGLDDFNNNRQTFIGVWEYDWYASYKDIHNQCSPYDEHDITARMKFSHEWYFYDCGVLKSWFPNVGSEEIFSNQKCMFDLKRTQ